MKKKRKNIKILIILILLLISTGCTKTLTDKSNKAVKNEKTGQTLTENILCQPNNKDTAEMRAIFGTKRDRDELARNFKGEEIKRWNSSTTTSRAPALRCSPARPSCPSTSSRSWRPTTSAT